MPPPAPLPAHLIRVHSSEVTVVAISRDNERLYSGDLSGVVAVTSTRSLRSISTWKAHQKGLLGVEEWGQNIITHGRDNKLHVWETIFEPTQSLGDTALRPTLPSPKLLYSLDVNALNFCRFSLLKQELDSKFASEGSSSQSVYEQRALIAVPNLTESSLADVWELPSRARRHAAVGTIQSNVFGLDGRGGDDATGILMSLHLFEGTTSSEQKTLTLLAAYESGEVMLLRYGGLSDISIEGRGWDCVWRTKQHKESVMAMAVSPDNSFALTVSADYSVIRYELETEKEEDRFRQFTIKQPGNGCIAIRHDGRVCAVGGWDGRVRLFSTKNLKLLGTLSYHEKNCQALAFAYKQSDVPMYGEEDEELTTEEKVARERWLIAGSQDRRITVWELMSFEK